MGVALFLWRTIRTQRYPQARDRKANRTENDSQDRARDRRSETLVPDG